MWIPATRRNHRYDLCQLEKKFLEMRTYLYTIFVDLTKAFDTVNREGLWKIMQKFDCPEHFAHMRAFRTRIGLVGYLRTQCAINLTTSIFSPTLVSDAKPALTATLVTDDLTVAAPTPASTAAASITSTTSSHTPLTDGTTSDLSSTSNITNIPTSSDVDSVHACPHYDRAFTPRINLVDHLRIYCTETGEPVPGTPTYTRRIASTVLIAPAHSSTAWVY
ncbi:hypothetical protein SprV_0602202500 [Sparganum proliferum]